MGRNSRPLMPLNNRVIFSSNIDDATWWTAPLTPVSITLAALLGFVILFLVLGCQQQRQEIVEDYEDDGIDQTDDYDLYDADPHID